MYEIGASAELSQEGIPIGAYWYPHWENKISIRIKVSLNWDSIEDVVTRGYPNWAYCILIGRIVSIRMNIFPNRDSIEDVVTQGYPDWGLLYPHWENMVSIRIKVSPNQESIVDTIEP